MSTGYRLKKDGRTRSWYFRIDLPPGADGERRQRWKSGFRTEREAKAAERAALAELEEGGSLDAHRTPYGAYLDRWLEEVVKPHRAAGTHRTYSIYVKTRIKPAFGNKLLAELKPPELRQFVHRLVEDGEVGPNTAKVILAILKRSLGQAVRDELLPRNPAALIEAPSLREVAKVGAPSAEAFRLLLRKAQTSWLREPVLLGADTGLRRGEVLGLRWEDVDLETGILQVRQQAIDLGTEVRLGPLKTRASRRALRITALVVEALREHQERQEARRLGAAEAWQDFDLVFPEGDGTPRRPQLLTDAFRYLCRSAGLQIHFHQLRHLSATLLRQGGIDTRTIAARMGHSDPGFTARIYEHITPLDQERATDVMDKALRDALEG